MNMRQSDEPEELSPEEQMMKEIWDDVDASPEMQDYRGLAIFSNALIILIIIVAIIGFVYNGW